MKKVENRLIMLWLFQYENLRIWNALQNKQNNVVIPPVHRRLMEFLARGPYECLKLMPTEDSTRTWIEIHYLNRDILLNREITSDLEISWATNAQSLGAAKYLWCLPWSHPALGFCFHPPSQWGVGLGEPSLCSGGLWKNFISLTLEGLMEKSCSRVGSRLFSREISI